MIVLQLRQLKTHIVNVKSPKSIDTGYYWNDKGITRLSLAKTIVCYYIYHIYQQTYTFTIFLTRIRQHQLTLENSTTSKDLY